jgi:hypothetical protein
MNFNLHLLRTFNLNSTFHLLHVFNLNSTLNSIRMFNLKSTFVPCACLTWILPSFLAHIQLDLYSCFLSIARVQPKLYPRFLTVQCHVRLELYPTSVPCTGSTWASCISLSWTWTVPTFLCLCYCSCLTKVVTHGDGVLILDNVLSECNYPMLY